VSKPRPFRFGVQEHRASNARAWKEKARRVEALGYSSLYLPDHFTDQLGPIAHIVVRLEHLPDLGNIG
jgi:alkanesulfonate monooxygenase SsuD/methylene tetrahydromethanopterin reductase-like flavin-dependent oxidoreductase (luciferase family)